MSYDEEIYNLKRHGIKEGFTPIEIDKNLDDILEEIELGFIPYQVLFGFNINRRRKIFDKNLDEQLKNQLEIGRKFMDGYFDLHAVQEIDEKDCDNLAKEFNDRIKDKKIDDITKYRYLVNEVKKLTKEVNPFNLKIDFINYSSEGFSSFLKEIYLYLGNEKLLSYDDTGFIFLKILFNLDNIEYDKLFPSYTHELAHTQLESIKGSYECYYNREVISIFLELVSALETDPKGDILRWVERRILNNLFNSIYALKKYKFTVKYKASCHVVSILEAFRLFEEYQNKSNIYEKLDVMYGIQDIFDGKITVENFLKNNGINFSNSKDLGLVKKRIDFAKGRYM